MVDMKRLLVSIAALAVVALVSGQGHAQVVGVTVCGKTVGVGFGSAPVGYGYGAAPTYGAGIAGHCGLGGVGYGMPGYGVPMYGVPNYGVSYGAPTYGGSCYGAPGYGYGGPMYGASCYGGGYGVGYGAGCQGGGYGMNYGVPDRCGNVGVGSPADINKKLDDLNKKLDDLQRFGFPKLQSSKSGSDRKPNSNSDDVDAMLAEIDHVHFRSTAGRVGAGDPARVATDEWQAMLAEVDRANGEAQVTRRPLPAVADRTPGPLRR